MQDLSTFKYYFREGFFNIARSYIANEMKLQSMKPELVICQAMVLYCIGEVNESLRLLQPFIKSDNSDHFPLTACTVFHHIQDNMESKNDDVVFEYESKIDDHENGGYISIDDFNLSIFFHHVVGNSSRASDLIDSAGLEDPSNPELENLGAWQILMFHTDVSDLEDAFGTFKSLVSANYNFVDAHVGLFETIMKILEKNSNSDLLDDFDITEFINSFISRHSKLPFLNEIRARYFATKNDWQNVYGIVSGEHTSVVSSLYLVLYYCVSKSNTKMLVKSLEHLYRLLDSMETNNHALWFHCCNVIFRFASKNKNVYKILSNMLQTVIKLKKLPEYLLLFLQFSYAKSVNSYTKTYNSLKSIPNLPISFFEANTRFLLKSNDVAQARSFMNSFASVAESLGESAEYIFLNAHISLFELGDVASFFEEVKRSLDQHMRSANLCISGEDEEVFDDFDLFDDAEGKTTSAFMSHVERLGSVNPLFLTDLFAAVYRFIPIDGLPTYPLSLHIDTFTFIEPSLRCDLPLNGVIDFLTSIVDILNIYCPGYLPGQMCSVLLQLLKGKKPQRVLSFIERLIDENEANQSLLLLQAYIQLLCDIDPSIVDQTLEQAVSLNFKIRDFPFYKVLTARVSFLLKKYSIALQNVLEILQSYGFVSNFVVSNLEVNLADMVVNLPTHFVNEVESDLMDSKMGVDALVSLPGLLKGDYYNVLFIERLYCEAIIYYSHYVYQQRYSFEVYLSVMTQLVDKGYDKTEAETRTNGDLIFAKLFFFTLFEFYDDSTDLLKQISPSSSRYAFSKRVMGRILLMSGRNQAFINVYKDLCSQSEPKSLDFVHNHLMLAKAYEDLNRCFEALNTFEITYKTLNRMIKDLRRLTVSDEEKERRAAELRILVESVVFSLADMKLRTYNFNDAYVLYQQALRAATNPLTIMRLKKSIVQVLVILNKSEDIMKFLDVNDLMARSTAYDSETVEIKHVGALSLFEVGKHKLLLARNLPSTEKFKVFREVQDIFNKSRKVMQTVLNQTSTQEVDVRNAIEKELCDILVEYGSLLEEMRRESQALTLYNAAIELNPDNVSARISIAELFMHQADYDGVISSLKPLVARGVRNLDVSVYSLLGKAYLQIDGISEALDHYGRLLGIESGKTSRTEIDYAVLSEYIQLALRSDNQECLENAEQLLQLLKLHRRDNDVGYHFALGMLYFYRSRFNDAIKELSHARHHKRFGLEASHTMINIYFSQLQLFTVPLKKNQDIINRTQLAIISGEALNLDIDDVNERVTEDDGLNKTAVSMINTVYHLIDEMPDAFLRYQQQREVYFSFCRIAMKEKQTVNDAIRTLQEIVAQNECDEAYLCLAAAHFRSGSVPKCRNALGKVVQLSDPLSLTFERGAIMLAALHLNSAKFDNAQSLCGQILRVNESHSTAYEYLGDIKEREHAFIDAIDLFAKAWELSSKSDLLVGFKLASCHLKAQNYVEVINICHQIFEIDSNCTEVYVKLLTPARKKLKRKIRS
ncbi:hypothetical protein PCE1_003906 [Barthelona sp. PCE]